MSCCDVTWFHHDNIHHHNNIWLEIENNYNIKTSCYFVKHSAKLLQELSVFKFVVPAMVCDLQVMKVLEYSLF